MDDLGAAAVADAAPGVELRLQEPLEPTGCASAGFAPLMMITSA